MDVIQMNMEELVPFVNAQEGEFFIRTFLGKEGEKRGLADSVFSEQPVDSAGKKFHRDVLQYGICSVREG